MDNHPATADSPIRARRTGRHALVWAGGLVLVVGALLLTAWLLREPPGLTEGNIRRIKLGMAVAEVEALLGCPACKVLVEGILRALLELFPEAPEG